MFKFLPLSSIVAWAHAALWGLDFLLIHHDGLGLREAQAVTISCHCHPDTSLKDSLCMSLSTSLEGKTSSAVCAEAHSVTYQRALPTVACPSPLNGTQGGSPVCKSRSQQPTFQLNRGLGRGCLTIPSASKFIPWTKSQPKSPQRTKFLPLTLATSWLCDFGQIA